MKKSILISSIIAIIITFLFAEVFSIYHFGDIPTILTLIYLVSLFSIFEYISLLIIYIINKKIKKEKINIKKIIGLVLLFIALILILFFIVVINIDYLNWYMYSSPFYINIIFRSIEFVLPAILFIAVSLKLIKK